MSTQARTDQNLLFGILAVQMDFISRDALITAMNAWALNKSKPLSQILHEQGALAAERRALLEALVAEHLKLHGNDAEKSLASVSSLGSIRQDLQNIADPDIQASLAHVSIARQAEVDPYATRPPTVGESTSAGTRFRILRPHAKGGLGEVFVAQDQELRREVALKEIQDRYADNPDSRSRFLREAEITGGLEHPSIVPVYGLGKYADGRPFYAMRFIRGDSLYDAIERFHKAEGPRRDPGERALALRQLLGRFVDVCDAIAYAHSRGVLHRDLKPGNIMLGPYGETLVVDWGLAKPLDSPAAEENGIAMERRLQPQSSGSATPTQMGSAIGTPGYMPPEQAAGRLDQLGPASDVYSLGATLYCLLTGKAPFIGKEIGEVLRKVQAGDFPRPRQVKQDVPAALEAVCLKAMALGAESRYADSRALAADVERWLADEPVSAYREPWRVRTGRWIRRHQSLVAATTAALLMVLLLGGGGVWWLTRQRAQQRQGVEAALAEVYRLQQQARWPEAGAVLDQAKNRLGETGAGDLREQLEQARRGLELVARLDTIHLKRSTVVEGKFDTATADREYAAAFQEAGLGEVGDDPATVAARVGKSAVSGALVAALDDWAGCTEGTRVAWVLEVARRADPDSERDHLRDPTIWQDGPALARLARTQVSKLSPHMLAAVGARLMELGKDKDAESLLRAAQERHPEDFWVNFNLGSALSKAKAQEAVGFYRAALALRPRSAATHNNLGNVLGDKGQPDEAISEYKKAIELDPKHASVHNNLGTALGDKGQPDEAISEYKKAIELDPKHASAHYNLGITLSNKGRLDEAIREYNKAIELDPKDVAAHNNLGITLSNKGRLDAAIREYNKAIELDPKYAAAHINLGMALQAKGQPDEAIAEYKKVIKLDPKHALAHCALGGALDQQGQFIEARQEIQRGLKLLPANDPLRQSITQHLRQCEQMLALDAKLSAILKGEVKPTDEELIDLARLCYIKKRHVTAARIFADAFAAQPKLADDLQAAHRYSAACFAALAAAGKGEDAAKLDDKERARLRKQALDWLRADLVLWSKQREKGTPLNREMVKLKMQHWQQDADLAGIRDKTAVDKLPQAERAVCQQLWADVATLLKKCDTKGQ